MLEYDSKNYDPPAPVAYVTLRNPQNGSVISNIPLLIDTGADATLLPLSAVKKLGVEIEVDSEFEVQVFDGETKLLQVARLDLLVFNKTFKGEYLLIDRPEGILGRNILNHIRLLLDGPQQEWGEYKK